MAVGFVTSLALTPATGSSKTSASLTVSGSNPVLNVHIGLSHATATVTSVAWSLGSGTAVQVKTVRNSPCFLSEWAIPAPTSGAGTYKVIFSTSVPYQVNADVFSGADQTTPCPVADAVASTAGASITSITLTPANVTASDGQTGCGGDTTGDVDTYSPNQTFQNDGTLINMESGYRLGTGNIVANFLSNVAGVEAAVGVRIAAAAAGGAQVRRLRALMGVGA